LTWDNDDATIVRATYSTKEVNRANIFEGLIDPLQ